MMNATRMDSGTNASVSATDLLEHTLWIKRLARILTLNTADADDLVQETWLAALAHPPEQDRPLLPWLAEVTRNAFRMRHRSDRRRLQREQASVSVGTPSPATPAELTERARLQQLLVGMVLELPEGQRDVLLLRFFDDLTSVQIAQRLAIPEGTVRWRLKEGLERLRVQLDERHGGNRNTWCAGIAVAFRLPPGPDAAPTHDLTKAATASSRLLPVAVMLTLLVGGGLYLRQQWKSTEVQVANHARQIQERAAHLLPSPVDEAFARELRSAAILGNVVDDAGVPVPGAVVAAMAIAETPAMHAPRHDAIATTEPEGLFQLDGLRPGDYAVTATAPGYLPTYERVQVSEGKVAEKIVLRLDRGGLDVTGTVEDVGGGVIPFATIEMSVENSASDAASFVANADGDGVFRLGVPRRTIVLKARARGYVSVEHTVEAGKREAPANVAFKLIPSGSVTGRVVDAQGGGVAGADVTLSPAGLGFIGVWSAVSGADGFFVFDDLTPGEYLARARAGALAGKTLVPWIVPAATSLDGMTVEIFAGLSIEGMVQDESGNGMGGVPILLNESEFGEGRLVGRAGADGRFKLQGLLPGSYSIEAFKVGYYSSAAEVTVLSGSAPLEATVIMRRLAGVRGRVVDADGKAMAHANVRVSWPVIRPHSISSRARTTITDKDGRFQLDGVSDGDVTLRARHPTTEPAEAELKLALQSGQVAEVEVRVAGNGGTVSGTVRWPDGTPAASVFVSAGGKDAITNAAGQYKLGFFDKSASVIVSTSKRDRWEVNRDLTLPSQRQVEVGSGLQLTGVDLVAPPADMAISGFAYAPDGKPAKAVIVEAHQDFSDAGATIVSTHEGGAWTTQALTDADGAWRIQNLDAGVYKISASMPGSNEVQMRGVRAGATDLKLQFKAVVRIEGEIKGSQGIKPSGCEVLTAFSPFRKFPDAPEHRPVSFFELHQQVVEVDERTGRFTVTHLDPGTYDVVSSCKLGGSGAISNLVLQVGETRTGLTIPLEEGVTVSGQVVQVPGGQPIVGATVGVWGAIREVRGVTDAEGRFRIAGIARGAPTWLGVDMAKACSIPAELIVISPPNGATEFDAGVVRVLRQPDCHNAGVGLYSRAYVQGTFVEKIYADTSAARAGIAFGDRVVAIDGKDVSTLGPRTVDLLLMGDAGSTVAVTVWSRTSNARRTVNLVRAER